ncbi:MAG: traS protein [Neisseriaceae bacterium]|nr:traS protein [Neisseriaceae bacterium]
MNYKENEKNIDELFYTRKIEKKHLAHHIHRRRPLREGYGARNLLAAADNAPQVVVKIPRRHGNSKGLTGITNHLDYISRNGQLEIEDQEGNIYLGKQEQKEIVNNLKKLGIPKESKRREAINFVFSMPPKTDPIKLKNAVRNFAQEQFTNHPYFFALHTDESHPHLHVNVLVKGYDGNRLNPRKADLMEYRIQFADHLRDQGVQCTATYQIHQGKAKQYQNSTIEHIKKRGGVSYIEQAKNSNQNYLTKENPYLQKSKNSIQKIQQNYANIFNIFSQNHQNFEAKKMQKLIQNFNANFQKITEKTQEKNNIKQQNSQVKENNYDLEI